MKRTSSTPHHNPHALADLKLPEPWERNELDPDPWLPMKK
jgi:hypothetical protein